MSADVFEHEGDFHYKETVMNSNPENEAVNLQTQEVKLQSQGLPVNHKEHATPPEIYHRAQTQTV